MQEDIVVNVNITRKDIKNYYFEKNRAAHMVMLVGFIIMLVMVLYFIFLLAVYMDWYMLLFLIILMLAIITAFTLLPLVFRYRAQIKELSGNNELMRPHCYRFNAAGYTSLFISGSSTIRWIHVDKIKVMKHSVFIYLTPYKINIIPKRCFAGEAQFEAFIKIISENAAEGKLHIKNRAFSIEEMEDKPCPGDHLNERNEAESIHNNSAGNNEFLEVSFTLTKSDLRSITFSQYYLRLRGMLITIVGLLLIGILIFDLIKGIATIPVIPLVGALITAAAPIMLYVNSDRMYHKERLFEKPYTYKFCNNCFVIILPEETAHVLWENVFKVSRSFGSYLIHTTKLQAYFIPKRIVKTMSPEDAGLLEQYLHKVE